MSTQMMLERDSVEELLSKTIRLKSQHRPQRQKNDGNVYTRVPSKVVK